MNFPAGTVAPEADIRFGLDNTYVRELSAGTFYEFWQPASAPNPQLLFFNAHLAGELGLKALDGANDNALAGIFSGNQLPDDAQPIAQAYAGHQFGHFSPQLGDGRALLVGECIDRQGVRRDIAFKGSGRTPFSRGGDGKAAVGPMLREVLISECLNALGLPTTRSLAVVATGAAVMRETVLPGAVLTRVASSHLRVGTFEYFSARRMKAELRRLLDYSVARHDPAIPADENRPLAFFDAVCIRQARLLAQWTSIGFIHGVMNTDNMALSGESIDFGPCAFMEAYDPAAVFSSIDTGGRYAFGQQPGIAQWNLARLAECLLPLMPDEDAAIAALTAALDRFPQQYEDQWLSIAATKMGLPDHHPDISSLLENWLGLLHSQAVDYTLAWRYLCDAVEGKTDRLRSLFADWEPVRNWLETLNRAGAGLIPADRAAAMRKVNPLLIARNHAVEAALKAASEQGDLQPFNRLLDALKKPFEENPALADLAKPAPAEVTACYRTFCGT